MVKTTLEGWFKRKEIQSLRFTLSVHCLITTVYNGGETEFLALAYRQKNILEEKDVYVPIGIGVGSEG